MIGICYSHPLIEIKSECNAKKTQIFSTRCTATKDKKLIENMCFIPFSINLAETDIRIKVAAKLMKEEGFPMATKNYEKQRLLGIVHAKINNYDAVVVGGQYVDPTIGTMFLRIVAILNPNQSNCIMVVAKFNASLSEANTANLMHKAGITYKVIESFEYLK